MKHDSIALPIIQVAFAAMVAVVLTMLYPTPAGEATDDQGDYLFIRAWTGCDMGAYVPTYGLGIRLRCLERMDTHWDIREAARIDFPRHTNGERKIVTGQDAVDCGEKRAVSVISAPNIVHVRQGKQSQAFVVRDIILGGGPYKRSLTEVK